MREMPSKTIYVSEADLPLFEEAQRLIGDNLSSTIIRALRHLILSEEAKREGFEEITVKVGKDQPYQVKQFKGRLLGKRQFLTHDRMRLQIITVYLTMRNKFVVRSKNTPNWSGFSGRSEQEWSDLDWSSYSQNKELTLDVYDTLEELQGHIPDDFYEAMVHALSGEEIEILDI